MRWFRRASREKDLDRELRSHLQAEIAERVAQGIDREEAHHAAHRALGNQELIKEEVRAAWGWSQIENAWQDLRYAARGFRRTPGFTAIVTLTLALGIGVNTAMFSVVDAVIFRSLPFRDANSLYAVWQLNKQDRSAPPFFNTYTDYLRFQSHSRAFDQVAAATWAVSSRIFSGHDAAREVLAMPVSLNYFTLLGRSPAYGRVFEPADLHRGCTAVLKHDFWRSAFNEDPRVIGRLIHLDDEPCTVIGVMPAGVTFFPDALSMWTLITPLSPIARDPEHAGVGVFAHLRPGTSLSAAQQELETIYAEAHRSDRMGAERVPFAFSLQQQFAFLTGPNLRLSLLVLFAAVSFVLLIACLNVANLLLTRFQSRQEELALRAAIGSRRSRLIAQLLAEALLLAATGSLLGLAVAQLAIHWFNVVNPVQMPPGNPIAVNAAALFYTGGLAIFTTLGFGLLPAWKSTRGDLNEILKGAARNTSHGRRGQRLARSLIALEIACSFVLLVGAGLLINSVARYSTVALGFSAEHLFSFDLNLPPWKYPSPADRNRLYARILREARGSIASESSALASSLPVNGGRWGGHALAVQGRSIANPDRLPRDVAAVQVSPGYFRLLGVLLLQGRDFTEEDRAAAPPVAIVNEALARKYFADGPALGRTIRFGDGKDADQWWTIAGVVADEKESDFFHEMTWHAVPTVFRPVEQDPPAGLVVITRTRGNSPHSVVEFRQTIARMDAQIPISDVEAMSTRLSHFLAYPRFRAVVLGGFAALALLLASLGLYGVLAQLVRQRRQEIGIRMALGAERRDVVLMVVKQAMLLVLTGLIAGMLVAALLTRFLAVLLYGITATDLPTVIAVAAILMIVAYFATYIPARRAATVDPSAVLRYE